MSELLSLGDCTSIYRELWFYGCREAQNHCMPMEYNRGFCTDWLVCGRIV